MQTGSMLLRRVFLLTRGISSEVETLQGAEIPENQEYGPRI
jgi:hypothetical protein